MHYKYNSSLFDGYVPCFFKYILFVWFSKSYAYPIGIAREQAEHSRKNKSDYLITVLRVFLTDAMKTLGTHDFQVLLGSL